MNFQQLVKKIKRDTWWSEEAPMNYQYAWAAWRAFTMQAHTFGREHLSICVMLCKNNFGGEKTSEQEKLSQFWHVFKEFCRDKKIKDYEDFKKSCKILRQFGQVVEKKLFKAGDVALRELYIKMYAVYQELVNHATMPEATDIYTDRYLLSDLRQELGEDYSSDELTKIALTLSCEPMLSFIECERRDFLRECLADKPNWEAISKKYHWIQNNYLSPKFLDAKYFVRQCRKFKKQKSKAEIWTELRSLMRKPNRLRSRQKFYLKRLRLSPKMRRIFAYLRYNSRWIDERKAHMMLAVYFVDILLQKISRRTKITKAVLGYYTPEEIDVLLSKKKMVAKKILAERQKLSVYVTWPKTKGIGELIYTGLLARKIFKAFESTKHGELKGMVASAPVKTFKGRVQIILNPHREKFVPGRILVTTMTRPDFVPLMRQAAAIITDEGGITSHAAIVSREMKIPCIIGTKSASKVLKNGQRVELDMQLGIIKILK